MVPNKWLLAGGMLSLLAAVLHLLIIVGGVAWYRFFGAGETLVAMVEAGSTVPDMLAGVIAILLFIWSCYAFSGAGLIRNLPLLKTVLVFICLIYTVRGLAVIVAYYFYPSQLSVFLYWSSAICFLFGIVHLVGIFQVWEDINYRPTAW